MSIPPTSPHQPPPPPSKTETHHFVDGLHDLQHLVVADLAVAVNVVQLEGPVELVVERAARRDAERHDELLEVDRAGAVGVKDVKDVVGKRGGVAKGEELLVYLLEFGLVERARGTVLQKTCLGFQLPVPAICWWGPGGRTFIPLLQLFALKQSRLLQLCELFLGKLGLTTPRRSAFGSRRRGAEGKGKNRKASAIGNRRAVTPTSCPFSLIYCCYYCFCYFFNFRLRRRFFVFFYSGFRGGWSSGGGGGDSGVVW